MNMKALDIGVNNPAVLFRRENNRLSFVSFQFIPFIYCRLIALPEQNQVFVIGMKNMNRISKTRAPSSRFRVSLFTLLNVLFVFLYFGETLLWQRTSKSVTIVPGAEVDSHQGTFESTAATQSPSSTPQSVIEAKITLYIITPSGRPSCLLRSIFYVLPFRKYFDVNWIVVHSYDKEAIKAPLFRNVFPWITELFATNKDSQVGNHQRNVAIEHVLSRASHGLVYFLDDDNTLSMDVCREEVLTTLSSDKMYYADQYYCGNLKDNSAVYRDEWTKTSTNFSILGKTDTGSWFTPVWLLKQTYDAGVRWQLDRYDADGLFYDSMLKSLLVLDGNDNRIIRLPSVKFSYNNLKDCMPYQWDMKLQEESLLRFRGQYGEMETVRKSLNIDEKMDRAEVTFHEYVHILDVLRSFVPRHQCTYVEIGVWKGATSIFMSRHAQHTDVIGIDPFAYERQREEAEGYRKALQGNGTIHWIKSYSSSAIPELQQQLNGKEIDILFIDGAHDEMNVRIDFELYVPLVSIGGFIVFDDFLDTGYSDGVRLSIMKLIEEGQINMERYDIIGSVPNLGAGPVWVKDEAFYDWQRLCSNEFVLRKRVQE